jgi:hypothetical protein
MRKFSVTSDRWEGEMTFEYYDNERLAQSRWPEVINFKALEWFVNHNPVAIRILEWVANNAPVKVTEIFEPIDFENFWELYDKKTGSKEMARQYWDGEKKTINKRPITEVDRQNIIKILKRYTAKYKGEQKTFQPLSTSFLHQRNWESELEAVEKTQLQHPDIDKIIAKFNTK